ncbi:MAG: sigma-70 family RNA polymerase sigma factor [Chloroflexota bacterium]|nr:MAG: hypothetical protein DIU68_11960 [Chloroflexota bacterium]
MERYERLVRELQASDLTPEQQQDAFSRLVEQFHAPAMAWAYAALGDSALAQDAVQEAFVSAYRNLDQLREPRAFPVWFRRIVRTECHRLLRSRRAGDSLDEIEAATAQGNPEETVEQRETREQVRHALRTLPARDREVIELYYITGYAQNEIASMLDLPLTTVKKRLQYARRRLKDALPQMYGPVSVAGNGFALPAWAALMEIDTLLYGYAESFAEAPAAEVEAEGRLAR